MVKSDIGLNPCRDQGICEVAIKLQALGVDLPQTFRKYPGPGDGEPVVRETHVLHQLDILLIPMIVIASNITAFVLCHFAFSMRKCIPDCEAFPILVPCTYNSSIGESMLISYRAGPRVHCPVLTKISHTFNLVGSGRSPPVHK